MSSSGGRWSDEVNETGEKSSCPGNDPMGGLLAMIYGGRTRPGGIRQYSKSVQMKARLLINTRLLACI
jgi:hypothetical protein